MAAVSASNSEKAKTGLRLKSQALRGVMEISFTSDEDSNNGSDRYFDTEKQKLKSQSQSRTLEADRPYYYQLRHKSGQR